MRLSTKFCTALASITVAGTDDMHDHSVAGYRQWPRFYIWDLAGPLGAVYTPLTTTIRLRAHRMARTPTHSPARVMGSGESGGWCCTAHAH